MFQDSVTFDDVLVNFTLDEWDLLDYSQRELYRDVVGQIFMNLSFIGKKTVSLYLENMSFLSINAVSWYEMWKTNTLENKQHDGSLL